MIFNKLKTKFKILAVILFGVVFWGGLALNVQATDLGGPTSANPCGDGAVSISKSASGSGTSPNGTISLTVSTTNVCPWIYWSVSFHGHAGPYTKYSPWTAWSLGTGSSYTFTFNNGSDLSAGDYTVSGDVQLWWWNGSQGVLWGNLSTTAGTVTISNPQPPPPPPPPIPVSPSLSGPSTANKGSTITHTWTSTTDTSYYMIRYRWPVWNNSTSEWVGDWGLFTANGQITGTSKSIATTFSNDRLETGVISCNSGGSCSWPPSNTITTSLVVPPPSSDNCGYTSSGEQVCINLSPSSINVTQGGSVNVRATYKYEPTPGTPRFRFRPLSLPNWLTANETTPTGCYAISGPPAGNECWADVAFSTSSGAPLGNTSVLVDLSPAVFTPDADQTFTLTVDAPTVSVSLTPNPDGGLSPLTTTLTAVVGGTATGNITYTFDCRNGTPVQTFTTPNTSQTVNCTYTSTDQYGTNFVPSVSVTRQGIPASRSTTVSVYPTPTVDLKVNGGNAQASLYTNQTATLTWTSSNASSCTSSGQWGSFSKSLNNTTGETVGPLSPETYTYTITCSNGGGVGPSDSVTILVPPQSIPVISCSGTPNPTYTNSTVIWGASWTRGTAPFTYKWSGPGTNSTDQRSASRETSYASTGTKTESIIVTGADGGSVTADCGNVTINYPSITGSCSAWPTSIYPGESAMWSASGVGGGSGSYTYSWTGTDDLRCNGQPKASCNSVGKTYNSTGTKTATITVNSGGSSQNFVCSSSVSVTNPPPATVSLSASPSIITEGQSSALSWNTSGGTSCSIDQGGGNVPGLGSGTISVSPNSTKTYTLTCSNAVGVQSSASATVTVNPQTLSVALTVTPPSGTAPLNNVTLSATISGTAIGTTNYTFYCDRNDTNTNVTGGYIQKYNNSGDTTKTATCNYSSGGTFYPKVIVERGTAPAAQDRKTEIVSWPGLSVSCSVSPAATTVNNTVSWKLDSKSGGDGNYSQSWSGTDGLSGSGATVNKSYSSAGTKIGTVTVTSGDGQSRACTPPAVTISNKPSISSFTTPDADIIQGESTSLSWACADSTTSSGTNFNTGGATSGGPISISPNTTTTYTLTCSNGIGESASASKTINVTPQSVSVSLSANPSTGRQPLSSNITATANVTLPPGTTLNYSFWWNCNNATTSLATAVGACGALPAGVAGTCQTNSTGAKCDGVTATTESLSNTYSQGSYTPKVILEGGIASPAEIRTTVTADYPLLEIAPPTTKTSTANTPVSFSVSGGTGNYNWTTPPGCVPLSGSGATFTLSCRTAGSYTITVTSGSQSANATLIIISTISEFKITPGAVNPGESYIISWLTTGYQTCSIDQGVGSVTPDSGSKTTFFKQNRDNSITRIIYTLTCQDSGGKTDTQTAEVKASKIPTLREILPK